MDLPLRPCAGHTMCGASPAPTGAMRCRRGACPTHLAPRTVRGGRSAWAMRHGRGVGHVMRRTPYAGHTMCGASPAPTGAMRCRRGARPTHLAPRTVRGGRSAWAMRHGRGVGHVVRGTPCAGHIMCGASPAPTMRRGRRRPRSGRCRPRRGSCRTAPRPTPAAPRQDSPGDASRPAGCRCSGSRRAG